MDAIFGEQKDCQDILKNAEVVKMRSEEEIRKEVEMKREAKNKLVLTIITIIYIFYVYCFYQAFAIPPEYMALKSIYFFIVASPIGVFILIAPLIIYQHFYEN